LAVHAFTVVITSVLPLLVFLVEAALVITSRRIVDDDCATALSRSLLNAGPRRQVADHWAQWVTLVEADVSVDTLALLITAVLPLVSSVVLLAFVRAHRFLLRSSSIETFSTISRKNQYVSSSCVYTKSSRFAIAGVVESRLVSPLEEASALGGHDEPAVDVTALRVVGDDKVTARLPSRFESVEIGGSGQIGEGRVDDSARIEPAELVGAFRVEVYVGVFTTVGHQREANHVKLAVVPVVGYVRLIILLESVGELHGNGVPLVGRVRRLPQGPQVSRCS